jgi:hypothetical protein
MRTNGIVMTEAGSDALVYDSDTHALHTLNPVVVSVWNACDGQQTLASLATVTGLDTDTVQQALAQLAGANLLDGALPEGIRPAQSRRAFMKKAAVGVAVPVIVSVTASTAASAASQDCGRSCAPFTGECFSFDDPFTCSICLPFSRVCGPIPADFASARMAMTPETVIAIEHELWGE